MSTGLECSVDLRIHLDPEILLLDDLLISFDDLIIYPLLKWRAYDCVDDVGNVRSRKLLSFVLLRRERFHHCWPIFAKLKHHLDIKSFEVRHLDCFDFGCRDLPFRSHNQISQMEY